MLTTSLTPHPDELSDRIKTKEIVRGGMQAIEDKAIEAYHQVHALTGCEQRAAQAYFEIFQHARS